MRSLAAKDADPNEAVRAQAQAVSQTHRRLYPWADRLRRLMTEHLDLEVPPIVIGVARLRRGLMGYYTIGRDALRLRGSIMLNRLYFELPFCWVLEVLAHEVLHFAEELSGEMSYATRSSYHTAWFRTAATTLGLGRSPEVDRLRSAEVARSRNADP